MAVPGDKWGNLIAEEYSKLNDFYNTEIGFLNELHKRGFNVDLDPNSHYKHEDIYRYFKDGKKQNLLIRQYVSGVVNAIFQSDKDV